MRSELLTQADFQARWSELHGGAHIKGAVLGWLKISFLVAKFLSRLRITPNLITLLGLCSAVAMVFTESALFALILLIASLFFDGIDGSVAIVQSRESRWGSVLDSLADRVSEALWLYVGWSFGIPAWVAISMWAIAATQEYARAKLASLGNSEVGVVTITERPVRAIFLAFVLLFAALDFSGIEIISYIFFAALAFSFAQVLRTTFLKLH